MCFLCEIVAHCDIFVVLRVSSYIWIWLQCGSLSIYAACTLYCMESILSIRKDNKLIRKRNIVCVGTKASDGRIRDWDLQAHMYLPLSPPIKCGVVYVPPIGEAAICPRSLAPKPYTCKNFKDNNSFPERFKVIYSWLPSPNHSSCSQTFDIMILWHCARCSLLKLNCQTVFHARNMHKSIRKTGYSKRGFDSFLHSYL